MTTSLVAFHGIITGPLNRYVDFSKTIGGSVMLQSCEVESAFQAQYNYLKTIQSRDQKQSSDVTSKFVGAVQKICLDNCDRTITNHLSMIGESIPALGWVQVGKEPGAYVTEMKNTAVYYGNRVLRDFKRRENEHVEWVNAWLETLAKLHEFVQQFHPTGLLSNDIEEAVLKLDNISIIAALEAGSGDGNQKCINRLVKSTYNNKNVTQKQPVIRQDGKKWTVMDYNNKHDLVIDVTDINNVVYVFRCNNITLTIKGKLNSMTVDSCKKSSVIFDSLISSAEFINSENIEMQALGTVPSIIVEKTHGCQLYLSKKSLAAEIVCSQCSQLNVLVPDGLDYKECAIPDQIKTTVDEDGQLKFAVVVNKG